MNLTTDTMVRFLLLLALAFLLININEADAQNRRNGISGYVVDASSGEPLPGAMVSADNKSTSSNNAGFYYLNAGAGYHTVACKYLGYETFRKEINVVSDTLLIISLNPEMINIERVVVVARDIDAPVASKFGRIDVNMQQLKYVPLFLGEQDVFKYFQILPGVTGGKEGSSELNIRGGSSDQTLILLDDVPIYNQNHAMGFVSIFNGDALGGAELYKGGVPATIGGRLSGFASMTTRNGNRNEHRQSLSVGTLTVSGLAEGPIKDKGSYIVSARYFTPHMLLNILYPIIGQNTRTTYMFYDVTGKISYDLNPKNTLSLAVYTGTDALNVRMTDEATVFNEGKGDYDSMKSDSRMAFNWNVITSAFKLRSIFKNGTYLNSTLYYSGVKNNFISEYSNDCESINAYAKLKSAIDEFGIKSVAQKTIGNSELRYGVTANAQGVTPKDYMSEGNGGKNVVNNGTINLFSAAVFFDNIQSVGKWGFHYGLRLPLYYNGDKISYNYEPRLGLSLDYNVKNSFFISYDRHTQSIFSLNKQFNGFPVDFWFPYRNNKIQVSNQISGGWKYKPISELFVSIEGFYKTMDNLVFISNEDAMLKGMGGYKMGKGNSYGGELIVQYTGKTVSVILSYAQTKSQRTVDGRAFDFVYDIPVNINLFAKYEVSKTGDDTQTASININYHTGLPYIFSNEVYPALNFGDRYLRVAANNPQYPNTRLVDYFRIDINYSFERKLKNGKRVWQLSLLNASNHFNPYMIIIRNDKYEAISLIPIMPSFSFKRYWQ